jgi:hypothetical protein
MRIAVVGAGGRLGRRVIDGDIRRRFTAAH